MPRESFDKHRIKQEPAGCKLGSLPRLWQVRKHSLSFTARSNSLLSQSLMLCAQGCMILENVMIPKLVSDIDIYLDIYSFYTMSVLLVLINCLLSEAKSAYMTSCQSQMY